MSADEPASPAPTGAAERVETVSPSARKKRSTRATRREAWLSPSSDQCFTSTLAPVSSATMRRRPSALGASRHSARIVMAAFSVWVFS